MTNIRWIGQALLFGLAAALLGCGGSDLPVVPVAGQLTFSGGPPPAAGSISYVPVAGTGLDGLPNRPGTANFGTDGKFVVSSFKSGDGLLPGRYTANIVCFVGTPSDANPSSFVELNQVPQEFHPELVVEKGSEPMDVTIDVPAKKK